MPDSWYKVGDHFIDFRCAANHKKPDALTAARHTVQYIMDTCVPPYYLMVSGGVDSQAMLWSWKTYGAGHVPISFVFDQDLNKPDLLALREFARRENIHIIYQNFDIVNFYLNDHDSIARKYQCPSPQIAAYLGMTQEFSGTLIFSGIMSDGQTALFDHSQRSLVRYSQEKSVVPFFFYHTPEMVYSTVSLPQHRISYESEYLNKVNFYHTNGFPVISQFKKINTKTGFEPVKDYFDTHFQHLVTPQMKLAYAHRPSRRVHDLVFRYPYEKVLGNPDYQKFFNIR